MHPKQSILRFVVGGLMGLTLWSMTGACDTTTKTESPVSKSDAAESLIDQHPLYETNADKATYEAPWTALQAPKTSSPRRHEPSRPGPHPRRPHPLDRQSRTW